MRSVKKAFLVGSTLCFLTLLGFSLSVTTAKEKSINHMQSGALDSNVRVQKVPLPTDMNYQFFVVPAGCCYSWYDYDDYTPYPYEYFHNPYWW